MRYDDHVIDHKFDAFDRDRLFSVAADPEKHTGEKCALDRSEIQRQSSGMPRDNAACLQPLAIFWKGHITIPVICSAAPVRHNPVQVCRSHRIENNV